jgi:hypothetical protein
LTYLLRHKTDSPYKIDFKPKDKPLAGMPGSKHFILL